jgi:RND family efflux transporter MFP subunit
MRWTTILSAGRMTLLGAGLGLLPACRREATPDRLGAAANPPDGRVIEVRDTTIPAVLEAAGIAAPVQRATLSTKVMGAVTSVRVQEGARVRAGQVLARIDARDIAAKRAQAAAGLADADAVHRDALTQAQRFRALYADSAATRAQLDAAETGLARAEAGVRTAQAAANELEAYGAYAEVRAPFAGMVTQRFVDPGAFVAPGAPIVAVEDGSRLRISVTVAPDAARRLKPGARVEGTIERVAVDAVVEGVAPAPSGALYSVNALVDNARGAHPTGGAAALRIPLGVRTGLLVPVAALVHEGDLTGVRVQTASGTERRWVRLGTPAGDAVEVLSGLRSGDRIFIPASAERGR